jgi:hypothetical protein
MVCIVRSSRRPISRSPETRRAVAPDRTCIAGWPALVWVTSSCTSKPLRVSVVFENGWTFGKTMLIDREKSLVRSIALETLRNAYTGFDVHFADELSGERLIKVEDAPYRPYGPGSVVSPGAVGGTYPVATVSSVYPDALYAIELAVARCQDIIGCDAKTREQLVEGLGRGIGATAAHELGHQAGLHFSRDSLCDDCYDSHSANTYVHFFGTKRWSTDALTIMKRVLLLTDSSKGS